MLGNIMTALMQPGPQGQASAGSQMLNQVVGGLMGGQGGGSVNQLLGGLQQVMNNKGQAPSGGASDPVMGLIGPIASAVAGKAGIPPAAATAVAATAMHYLISSHPAAGGSAPLNLNNVAQEMASGGVSQQTLQSSGMVNAVAKSTGLSQDQATQALNATFQHLSQHVDLKAQKHEAAERRDIRRDRRGQ